MIPHLCALLLALPPALAQESGEAQTLLLGARVLAPDAGGWLEGQVIVLRDGRIEAIVPAERRDRWPDATVLALDGLFVVPGLVDLHTHLLLHPYDETSWNDQVLKESLELRTVRAVVAARATLAAGFTTIRELGTEGAGFADVALRDAIAAGIVEGPRILAATRAIVASGCYGPSGFDPRWKVPKGAQEADGVDGVRVAVREQIAAGADWIKVYADYRRRPGDASTPTFSQEELAAIVHEATSAGLPVAAHASTDEAIRRAVAAGVRTIEHGTSASRASLELMRDAGVTLCPTLGAVEAVSRYAGWRPGGAEPESLRAARATFVLALEVGVDVACGSDAGVFAHGDNAIEPELMVAWGMSPADALRSATSGAARVLGREADLGRIAPGFVADLVVLRGDPLAAPSELREPVLVLRDGRVVVDRSAARR